MVKEKAVDSNGNVTVIYVNYSSNDKTVKVKLVII